MDATLGAENTKKRMDWLDVRAHHWIYRIFEVREKDGRNRKSMCKLHPLFDKESVQADDGGT